MRRLILLVILLLCVTLGAEIKFIPGFEFDIRTAPVVDVIRIEHTDGRKDVLEGNGSLGFLFEPGFQLMKESYEARLSSGIGFLHNNLFNSVYFSLEGSVYFDTGSHLMVGPHLGTFYLLSAWDGDKTSQDDISMQMNSPGIIVGVSITSAGFGARMIGSLDYVSGKIDLDGKNGWVPGDDQIDYQGLSLRMGLGF